jgi:ribosomal protein S18 acetylase RimI-like enzyme
MSNLKETKLYEIIQATEKEHISEIKTLFLEYSNWLGELFCFQGFEEELASLPGKYASPSGRLYLVFSDGKSAGCIGIRKIDDEVCEMKRLYVRPEARGLGIGKKLVDLVVSDAKQIGYKKMLLDTLPHKMQQAQKLYRDAGFYGIDAYYANPIKGVMYMELDLTK